MRRPPPSRTPKPKRPAPKPSAGARERTRMTRAALLAELSDANARAAEAAALREP